MGMITAVRFKNYKRLKKFSIKTGEGNILVGPNNSGKSSILDAFRILESCLRYCKNKKPTFSETPLGITPGYDVPESYCSFHLTNAITNYADESAVIEFDHQNGSTAYIYISPDRTIKFFVSHNNKNLKTAKLFREAFPVDLIVVPTLSPLESVEPLVQADTVRRNRTTKLAARSFRNIWHLESAERFALFQDRIQRAWPEVKIKAPELVYETPPRVEMYFEENRVTREVQWAGFGFQVWLQIHTHLIRGGKESILILDEPDVYLHPELQHRLYNDVKEIYGQYFIATHATEIINVADTSEIFVIDPKSQSAKRVKRDADYDAMLNYIGSAENADFAKIVRARKVLFVEGKDAKILRRFARRLGLENVSSERKAPIFQLGGFSQWKRAETSVWAFKNLLDVEISTFCLFDRDYRSDKEVTRFLEKINTDQIECLVLLRKEIENYLLCPKAITKSIVQKKKSSGECDFSLEVDTVHSLIFEEAEQFATDVSAHTLSNYLRFHKATKSGEDDSTIIRQAQRAFTEKWSSFEGRMELVPGKELLGAIMRTIQSTYRVSISVSSIQENMSHEDIGDEMCCYLRKLDAFFSSTF